MGRDAFDTALRADGYTVLERELEPGFALDQHDHAWDVRGLVLAGSFTIATGAGSRTCRVGESFVLDAGIPHTEHAGAEGARLLLGRRQR